MPRAHRIAFFSVLVALVVGTTGCARRRDNGQVVSEVQYRIRADSQLAMARLQVTGVNNVITLAGYVVSNDQRAAAVRDAQQVEGVRTVVDNLRLVGSTPQTLTAMTRKPSASAQKASRPSAISRASVARKVTYVDSAPQPSVEAAPSDSPSSNNSPAPTVTTATVSSAIASTARRPVSDILPDAQERIVVADGTVLTVRLNESLNSDLNEKGDTFIASLASPILVNDRVVVPEGAGIKGTVVEIEGGGRYSGRPAIVIDLTRLGFNGNSYDLQTDQYSKKGSSRSVRSAATIGGGAGLGAILGGILGGGRGAAIGAMIGAGVGTGVEGAGKGAVVQLPAESVLSFRLQAPLTVTPASTLRPDRSADPDSSSDSEDDRPVLKRRPGSIPRETTTDETPTN